MAEKILVALRRDDQVEEIVSYLKQIVRPGMGLLFLFPYPVHMWSYLLHHWIEADSAREALRTARTIAERDSWEKQKELAKRMIAPAHRAFQDKDIKVEVDLYTGRLERVLQDYEADSDIHWILTNSPTGGWIGTLVAKTLAPLGWSTRMLSIRLQPN